MKSRILGFVLLVIAGAGRFTVARRAMLAPDAEPGRIELLLSLVAVPFAPVGLALLIFGPALFGTRGRGGRP